MKKIVSILFFCTLFVSSINSYSQTYPVPFSQPYFEGFEGTVFPPVGWQRINVSGNVEWIVGYWFHTGAKATVCAWQQVGIGEDWLITPRWNIQTGDSLVFWLRPFYVGHPPDSLAVRVSTTDSNMSSFTTRILYIAEGNGYPTTTTYQRYAASLNQFAGQEIFIAFKHMDQNGDGIFIDDVSVERIGPSGITKLNNIPAEYKLSQNYPNPFNPVTKIKFSIVNSGETKLIIYDVMGREIQTLVNEKLQTGSYEVTFNIESATEHRRTFGSGVYFCKLISGSFTETKKLTLLK